jgi:hypothetical protein
VIIIILFFKGMRIGGKKDMKKTRDPPARALVSQNKKKHECCSYL